MALGRLQSLWACFNAARWGSGMRMGCTDFMDFMDFMDWMDWMDPRCAWVRAGCPR